MPVPSQFTVLVVDDEVDKLEMLRVVLEMEGYSVVTARDGVQGLAAVESHRPDLIVTDVMMPNMDGFEMARRVRANPQTRFIPIIIQSAARATADDLRRGHEVGALGYLTDPTDITLLLARARTLVEFKNYLDSTEEAAYTDDLTDLGNGRQFKRRLDREVARAQRYGHPFSLLLFEVNNFARLIEVFGREAGEETLRCVADALLAGTRGIDTAARLEQALFAVISPETSHERALEVAERLRAAVGATAVPGVDEPVTVSFGIAEFPSAARDKAGLLEAAHVALGEAKRARKAVFGKALAWVKSFVRERGDNAVPPTCFISYAWSTPQNDDWVAALAKDLKAADVQTILDRRDNAAIGSSIPRFISRIETCDYIVVVGTPLYREKYLNKISAMGSVAAAEVDLINSRLVGTEEEKNTVLPLLREGEPQSALPPLMRARVCGDFRHEENYLESLFVLILTLYRVPFDHPTVEGFRESLSARR